MDDGAVVAVAVVGADLCECHMVVNAAEIHGDVAGEGYILEAGFSCDLVWSDSTRVS